MSILLFYSAMEVEVDDQEDLTQIEVDDDTSLPPPPSEKDEMDTLKTALCEAKETIEQLQAENKKLHMKLAISKFGIHRFTDDSKMIKFYTGFQNYQTFLAVFNWLQPSASSMTSHYYQPSETISLAGSKRTLPLIDEFFMFLCRLRVGM